MGKSLKQEVGDRLEAVFPGQVQRDVSVVSLIKARGPEIAEEMGGTYSEGANGTPTFTLTADSKPKRRMARVAETDTPLPLGDTTSRRAGDDRLRLLIERVERLEEEKKGIADDIRDVYGEARAVGYDAKIMRQIVRLRKMKPDERAEFETLLDTYKHALGLG